MLPVILQLAIPIGSAAAIGFSILIVPLLDTLRVFAIRIFKGCSPFTPDRNHVHHLLLDLWIWPCCHHIYLCRHQYFLCYAGL